MTINLHKSFSRNIFCILFISLIAFYSGCSKKPEQQAINKAPVANAGADQTITLPVNQVSLAGTGTDADGNIVSFAWTKVSGPAGGTITTASSANTTVTGLVTGVYVFKLTVTDNKGSTASDEVQVIVSTTSGNMPPVANAGTDQTITLPVNQASLTGSGTDVDGTITAYAWTKVSGPSGGIITTASSANTTVTGLLAGVYVYRLTVTDNLGATGTDDIQLTVNAAINIPPVANAGTDQTITLPTNQVSLTGTGTDADGTISSYAWTKVSGPAGESITTPSAPNTTVTGLTNGVFVFMLTVTDNLGSTATDNVQVTVNTSTPTKTNHDYFVSSQNTNSVKRYHGVTGAYLGDFVSPGSGGLANTQEVMWGLDNHLLVVGAGSPFILRYDSANGNFLGQFSTGYSFQTATKMAFGPDGKIYVSQWSASQNKIVRFNGTTGAFIDEFTNIGLGANNAMGQAWDASGRLYVACYGTRDVKRFDINGNFIDVFIPTGTGAAQLLGPVNIWFDNNNNFFIIDWQAGKVKKYNATTGAFIADHISGLVRCEGFTFDQPGNLYIGRSNGNTVNKYDANGNLLGVVVSGGGLSVANSVIIGPLH